MPMFEFRLVRPAGQPLLFASVRENAKEAATHALKLLERNPGFGAAEVWLGMNKVCADIAGDE